MPHAKPTAPIGPRIWLGARTPAPLGLLSRLRLQPGAYVPLWAVPFVLRVTLW